MANRNNLPNLNDNNEDDVDQSSDENEEYAAAGNIQQPTPRSQSVTEERSIDPQDMTNEYINGRILNTPDQLGAAISIQNLLMFILLYFGINQSWGLLIFILIDFRLMNYNDEPDLVFGQVQPTRLNWELDYSSGWNRDAQAEGRTAHEVITFPNTVEIVEPFGIEDTQPHDIVMLVGLNNIQRVHVIPNNENGDVNEDGTLYNNNDDDIITLNIQNELNVQTTVNEHDAPQAVFDDPTYNINPIGSIEVEDVSDSSDSSDEEDQIASSDSGFNGDDEDDSPDDDDQRGRASPTTGNLFNPIQNNPPLNQTNAADEQTSTRAPSSNEALEIVENVAPPVEGACRGIIPLTHPTSTLITKLPNIVRPRSESSEESSE